MIATAAGLTAPNAVSTAAIANMTQGMATRRPRTARTAAANNQSMVPLFCAIANSRVMPIRVTASSSGKPLSRISSPSMSVSVSPSTNAPTKARMPMLIGSTVAITNIATRTRIEMSSGDTMTPWVGRGQARPRLR
jgi:hypothetical protein